MSTHADLKREASNALNKLFGDKSVPQSKTRSTLEELRDEIDVMLDALPRDV